MRGWGGVNAPIKGGEGGGTGGAVRGPLCVCKNGKVLQSVSRVGYFSLSLSFFSLFLLSFLLPLLSPLLFYLPPPIPPLPLASYHNPCNK